MNACLCEQFMKVVRSVYDKVMKPALWLSAFYPLPTAINTKTSELRSWRRPTLFHSCQTRPQSRSKLFRLDWDVGKSENNIGLGCDGHGSIHSYILYIIYNILYIYIDQADLIITFWLVRNWFKDVWGVWDKPSHLCHFKKKRVFLIKIGIIICYTWGVVWVHLCNCGCLVL